MRFYLLPLIVLAIWWASVDTFLNFYIRRLVILAQAGRGSEPVNRSLRYSAGTGRRARRC